MTARPITIAQPPLKPCTNRATIITPIDGVSAHTTEASDITTSAASSGRRRPRWSETGPPISWPSAMPTKNVVSVSCTCVAVAPEAPVAAGAAR